MAIRAWDRSGVGETWKNIERKLCNYRQRYWQCIFSRWHSTACRLKGKNIFNVTWAYFWFEGRINSHKIELEIGFKIALMRKLSQVTVVDLFYFEIFYSTPKTKATRILLSYPYGHSRPFNCLLNMWLSSINISVSYRRVYYFLK